MGLFTATIRRGYTNEVRKEDLWKNLAEDIYNRVMNTDYQTKLFNIYLKSHDSSVYKVVVSKEYLKDKIGEVVEKYDIDHLMDEDEVRNYLKETYAKFY